MSNVDELPEPTVEWLSLIRYQLLVAGEQSRLGRPMSALSINAMQDAVESALSLVVQSRGGNLSNRPDFLQLFDAAIGSAADVDRLKSFRPAMIALNSARVSFKHHGNAPDDSVLTRHLVRSQEFVAALVGEVFEVDIQNISLLVFVKCIQAREHLLAAQDLWTKGEHRGAMEILRLAFDELVRDYTNRKQWYPGHSLFATKPSFFPSSFDLRKLGKEVEKMNEWLENLDKWVKYVALGIDMRRFAYFDVHAPKVMYAMGGNHFTHHDEAITIDDEVFARSFKFVVDTGLALAQDDYDFDHWSARQAAREAHTRANDESLEGTSS